VIIAGDGYAYIPYSTSTENLPSHVVDYHVGVLRVTSSGTFDHVGIMDWSEWFYEITIPPETAVITNGDTGALITFVADVGQGQFQGVRYMAITAGTSVSLINGCRRRRKRVPVKRSRGSQVWGYALACGGAQKEGSS
jgi:hypothetical protein